LICLRIRFPGGDDMRLIAFGGGARMEGALAAAKKSGWDTVHVRREEDVLKGLRADAVMLPWPHSFSDDRLVGGEISRERTLALLPPCRALLHGGGVSAAELPQETYAVDPAADEEFLKTNAELTAEGAIARLMQRPGCALLGSTCVITGFGRIGKALAARLCALSAFVIVCARSEAQMRQAHDMGAHPVPLMSVSSALRHADAVLNTVPARLFGWEELRQIKKGALYIELASKPFGAEPALAEHLGVSMVIESGLPGRYASQMAGAALFGVLQRALDSGCDQGGEADD